MLQSDYNHLKKLKAAAIAQHKGRTIAVRRTIAEVVVREPERALAAATRTLARKKDPQLQWSKAAWVHILRTRKPQEIADLLLHPSEDEQVLADFHPFGGLAAAGNSR